MAFKDQSTIPKAIFIEIGVCIQGTAAPSRIYIATPRSYFKILVPFRKIINCSKLFLQVQKNGNSAFISKTT